MSKLVDKLFANNPRSICGKRQLRSMSGEPVVHMDTPEDVDDYCRRMQYHK